ncbi:amidase [Actinokineospora sp. HUAS TT18]|uniref:amidase n=1 Tax=Actinokineospora sp. HUAS TT18 TaxID=3447451 RepID=UPI003F51F3E8
MTRVHAFTDDALADHDAVGIADLIRRGELSVQEVESAAIERIKKVDPTLNAVAFPAFDRPRRSGDRQAALFGVPTLVKDNTDVAGMPCNHGTAAYVAKPSSSDGRYARQYLSTGMTVLGKSRMPEFGFNASTEYMGEDPVRNPWNLEYSVGASSGGAAALVAAGAVPIAHANDGGGSIRIPAAAAGLIGLKPSRGRHRDSEQAGKLPINMISEGVVTRSVRDTAAFFAAVEDHWRNPALPPVGQVFGPSRRRLRVGLVLETATGAEVCPQTRAAVEHTASLLEKQGHHVEPISLPVDDRFAADFTLYWGLLATLAAKFSRFTLDRSFDARKLDGLTQGLRGYYRRHVRGTARALYRLRNTHQAYAAMFARHEVVLSPVLAHVTPRLGHLSPTVPFDELLTRLTAYCAYTPLNNIAGTPGLSLPMGMSAEGVPIGVHLSAAYGDERTLIEVAFGLEEQHAWPRIQG